MKLTNEQIEAVCEWMDDWESEKNSEIYIEFRDNFQNKEAPKVKPFSLTEQTDIHIIARMAMQGLLTIATFDPSNAYNKAEEMILEQRKRQLKYTNDLK